MPTTTVGAQQPRVRIEPERSYTDGDNAAALSAAYGNELDEWQRLILDCWLGRDEEGNLTATTCGVPVPRQNGKNAVIEAFELDLLLFVPNTHILHTAHQVKTEKKAFRRLAGIFENKRHPELNAELKTVRRTNGEEAIELHNGNTIEYASRSRGGGRGFDAITCVIYDEAQELTDDQVEALMSTLAASPTGDRQTIYAGTPPSDTAPGEVFKRIRKSALEHPTSKTAWHEWGIDGDSCPVTDDMDYSDVRPMVFETNPAMGVRLSDEFTEQEFNAMTPRGFARERLGWWDSQLVRFNPAFNADEWQEAGTGKPPKDGKRTFGVKFSPEGDRCAVAVCVTEDGANPFVELVDDYGMPSGLAKVADFLAGQEEKTAEIRIDGKAYAAALAAELDARGVSRRVYRLCTTDNVTTAAAKFAARLSNRSISHIATDGNDMLSLSVKGCAKRTIGSNGGWGLGDGSERSYPAEAATLALFANETTKRDPNGGMSVWW